MPRKSAAARAISAPKIFDRTYAAALPDAQLGREILLIVLDGLIDPQVLKTAAATLPISPAFDGTGPIHEAREREAMRLADIMQVFMDGDFVPDDGPKGLGFEKAIRLAARGELVRAAKLFRSWLHESSMPTVYRTELLTMAKEAARRGERAAYSGGSVIANRRDRMRAMALQVAMEHVARIRKAAQSRHLPTKMEFLKGIHSELVKKFPGFVDEGGKPKRTVSALHIWLLDTEPMREIERLRRLHRD
jgi:hypothetical protein